jgi:serine/threonine-protein kinase SRPK3
MESSGNSQPDVTYRVIIEGIEPLERYLPRGYCIPLPLEFGSYSTVWLARDEKADRYVAIKIVVAQVIDDSQECTIMRSLGDKVHPWKDFI